MSEHLVYIGLGSNLGDSITTLRSALSTLRQYPVIQDLRVSRLYYSKPVGPQDQPNYWNAAACFSTSLAPLILLDLLLQIEKDHGRDRTQQIRWGARTLDLDILLYDHLVVASTRLTIPHPYLTSRAFVVCPLLDLNPQLTLPSGQLLTNYLADLQNQTSTLEVSTVVL
jgi:2-amino-4-hydroxy-6-hydroxymethyldihydropteridine diphosphokinase